MRYHAIAFGCDQQYVGLHSGCGAQPPTMDRSQQASSEGHQSSAFNLRLRDGEVSVPVQSRRAQSQPAHVLFGGKKDGEESSVAESRDKDAVWVHVSARRQKVVSGL